jgi:hypothetical protein
MGLAIETRRGSAGTIDRHPTVVGRLSDTRGGTTVEATPVPLAGEALEGQGSEQVARGARWRWWLAIFMAGHPSVCP